MFEFADVKTAKALVKFERDRSKVVYADYIAANGVTLDTVSAHVSGLQSLAFPDFDAKTADDEAKYVRKSFGNRVRNGLNTHLGKVVPSKAEPVDASTGEADDDGADDVATAPVALSPVDAVAVAVQVAHDAGVTADDVAAIVARIYA